MSFYCKLPVFGYCHVAFSEIEALCSWEDFLLHWSILELNFNIGILPKLLITLSWWVASSEKINTSSRIFSVSRVMILTTTANSIWAPLWLKEPCNKCIDWIAYFQTEQTSIQLYPSFKMDIITKSQCRLISCMSMSHSITDVLHKQLKTIDVFMDEYR